MRLIVQSCLIIATILAADNPPVTPVTIHLELADDTFAFLEPLLVNIEMTNLTDEALVLDYLPDLWADVPPPGVSIVLIYPTGFKSTRSGILNNGTELLHYFLLPAHMTLTNRVFLDRYYYMPRFEKMTALLDPRSFKYKRPGQCKLYLEYQIPRQSSVPDSLNLPKGPLRDMEPCTVYSDTVDFTYVPECKLPPYRTTTPEFLARTLDPDLRFPELARRRLKSLMSMGTPYSEEAGVVLLESIWDYHSFLTAKALFDSLYPDSYLKPLVLQSEFRSRKSMIICWVDGEYKPPACYEQERDLDSLLVEWKKLDPLNMNVLILQDSLETFFSWDLR